MQIDRHLGTYGYCLGFEKEYVIFHSACCVLLFHVELVISIPNSSVAGVVLR